MSQKIQCESSEKEAFTAQLVKWTLCMSARKELSGTSPAGSLRPMASAVVKLQCEASLVTGNQNGFV